ncbi:hypothetical protein RhiirC2_785698, partial [Rhizophagus irregularis]
TPEEVVNARFDPLDVSVPVEPISENIAIEDDSENITNDNTPSEGGSTWHDIFNIQIPNDLLPYIAEPVYKSKNRNDKRIHDPGSTQWFKAIRSRKAAVDTKAKEQLRIDKLTEKARFWGTSTNSVDYREGLVDDLTNYQNHYHEHMNTSLRDNNIDVNENDSKTKRNKRKKKSRHPGDYYSFMDARTYAPFYRYKGNTSDDTRILELRPKKRPTNLFPVQDRQMDLIKKLKRDTSSLATNKGQSLDFLLIYFH